MIGGTHYFCVDKGLDDSWVVYNGTSCGLNNVLWAPLFGLPTIKQTLQALLPGYLQCDHDAGEQFLNYPLHADLREYLGVDLREVCLANLGDSSWEAEHGLSSWEQLEKTWMGLCNSPYCSLQWQARLKY